METSDAGQTEAELQARFRGTLAKELPFLPAQYKLERFVFLQIGHQRIEIDGHKPKDGVRGRYDMLVQVDGKSILLVELKAPEVDLTEDDIDQARSYAALVQVPVFLVTNGRKTKLRFTHNSSAVDPADLAQHKLEHLLANAAKLAAADTDNAIRVLMGSSDAVWQQVFATWTAEAIAQLTGAAQEFRRPIVKDFSILREVTKSIEDELAKGSRLIVLHGPPLSGVTNVLAQLAGGSAPGAKLFVDAHAGKDILQSLANRLGQEIAIGVSKDDLRKWFNTIRGLVKITLVLDGFPGPQLDELIEWAKGGHFQLVVGMDSETHRKARSLPGRNQDSPLGRSETAFELGRLSDSEFSALNRLFLRVFNAGYVNGAQYATDLRSICNHRVIAASLPRNASAPAGVVTAIPAFRSPSALEVYNNAFVTDPQLRLQFQKLANAYLKEMEKCSSDPNWVSGTWGLPSVSPEVAEQSLGREGIDLLTEQGFLSWADSRELGQRLLIRIEEIFAHYIAQKWAADLIAIKKTPAIERKIRRLVGFAAVIPDGPLALAAAIHKVGEKRFEVVGITLNYLLKQQPTTSRLKEGAKIRLLTKGRNVTLNFGKGMDEEVVENVFPWIILSQFAFWPMVEADSGHTFNLRIFATLGASRHLLLHQKPTRLEDHQPVPFHELEGAGSFQAFEAGIIEPLVQAMVDHAQQFPEEFQELARYAIRAADAHLTRRVHLAARALEGAVDVSVATMSKEVSREMFDWWASFLVRTLGRPSSDLEEFKKSQTRTPL